MKWLKRLAVVFAIIAVAVTIYALGTARRSENPVGFQVVVVESPNGPLAVALWYPTTAAPRPTTFLGGWLLSVARDGPIAGNRMPVVLISHGNNGSALSHVDLAMDLASAGYVVAAPTHTGDNYADQSRQGSPALFNERAGQLRATLDFVLKDWPGASQLDANRVGAYGLSAGGFTILTLIGGVPDMGTIPEHCAHTPEFICKALAHVKSPLLITPSGAGTFGADARIKAAAVAAPGLGFTFAAGGLSNVRVPVQVWSGERDDTVPFETNTKVVLQGLGGLGEHHQMRGATHRSFLAPCGLLKPPALCSDPDGFDRETSHAAMNAAIVQFFHSRIPAATAAR